MARVFSSDINHSIIPEATQGTTPTTGATRYELPVNADQGLLTAEATSIKSNTKRPNNAANGSQRGMTSVSGAIGMRGFSGQLPYFLMESLLRSSFVGTSPKVLKAGTTDKSFSVISALASDQYKTYAGCIVKGLTIDAKANDIVTFNWDLMGLNQTLSSTNNPLTVTPTVYTGPGEYEGSDVVNLSIAGQSASYSELSIQITADRTQSPILGSTVGLAFGYNGVREIKVTIKAYRTGLALEQALTGAAQSFSVDIGTTGSGITIAAPSMYFDVPTDELNNGSAFVNITGTAAYDNTLLSDISITQL